MKIVLLLLLFLPCSILKGMQHMECTPQQLIELNHPTLIQEYLKEEPYRSELIQFRDNNYNNLIHLVVMHLIKQGSSDFDVDKYRPLLHDFVVNGININEANDDHITPISRVHQAKKANSNTMQSLARYLFELGAVESANVSFSTYIRNTTNCMLELLCIKRMKYKYN